MAIAILVLLAGASGCGESEGVASGATVRAYVVPPLCDEAESELAHNGGKAGDLRVKVVCLHPVERRGRLNLVTIGENARRATEDSTAVAFLEAPGKSNESSRPILESAEIPLIRSSSGVAAMTRMLKAIERAGSSGSLRSSLSDELE